MWSRQRRSTTASSGSNVNAHVNGNANGKGNKHHHHQDANPNSGNSTTRAANILRYLGRDSFHTLNDMECLEDHNENGNDNDSNSVCSQSGSSVDGNASTSLPLTLEEEQFGKSYLQRQQQQQQQHNKQQQQQGEGEEVLERHDGMGDCSTIDEDSSVSSPLQFDPDSVEDSCGCCAEEEDGSKSDSLSMSPKSQQHYKKKWSQRKTWEKVNNNNNNNSNKQRRRKEMIEQRMIELDTENLDIEHYMLSIYDKSDDSSASIYTGGTASTGFSSVSTTSTRTRHRGAYVTRKKSIQASAKSARTFSSSWIESMERRACETTKLLASTTTTTATMASAKTCKEGKDMHMLEWTPKRGWQRKSEFPTAKSTSASNSNGNGGTITATTTTTTLVKNVAGDCNIISAAVPRGAWDLSPMGDWDRPNAVFDVVKRERIEI